MRHIGAVGAAGESGRIRIGSAGAQTTAFIAGVNGAHVTGAAVYVTAAGQLGILASSERYKTQFVSMGSSTVKLNQLRPVMFHLKSDPRAGTQYGLIAEEVARAYPELVTRDENGVVQGVRYEELAPVLLNEVQKQAAEIRALESEVRSMRHGLRSTLDDSVRSRKRTLSGFSQKKVVTREDFSGDSSDDVAVEGQWAVCPVRNGANRSGRIS